MSDIVIAVIGLLGTIGGGAYLWNKFFNDRALFKATKKRKEIKIVVDEHKRRNPELNEDVDDLENRYSNYHERNANQPDGDSE